jgi:hypothetical protein
VLRADVVAREAFEAAEERRLQAAPEWQRRFMARKKPAAPGPRRMKSQLRRDAAPVLLGTTALLVTSEAVFWAGNPIIW